MPDRDHGESWPGPATEQGETPRSCAGRSRPAWWAPGSRCDPAGIRAWGDCRAGRRLAASQWISTPETPSSRSAAAVSTDAADVATPRRVRIGPYPVPDLEPSGADPVVQAAEAEQCVGLPAPPATDGELELTARFPVSIGLSQELPDRPAGGRLLGPGHPWPQLFEAAVDGIDQFVEVHGPRPVEGHVRGPERSGRPGGQPSVDGAHLRPTDVYDGLAPWSGSLRPTRRSTGRRWWSVTRTRHEGRDGWPPPCWGARSGRPSWPRRPRPAPMAASTNASPAPAPRADSSTTTSSIQARSPVGTRNTASVNEPTMDPDRSRATRSTDAGEATMAASSAAAGRWG